MANELDQFEALDTNVGETPKVESDKKAAKKQTVRMYKEAMQATLKEDPDYLAKHRSLSDTVKVVNTLGFGTTGGLIESEGSTKENRLVQTVSAIVGYKVQNIGEEPIPYFTEEFAANEDGKYVGQKVKKTLAPGEATVLSRKYATVLFAQPEFNLKIANGKFIPPRQKKTDDIDAFLAGHYFIFSDSEHKVNDDTIKLQVGEQRKSPTGASRWYVKPEYEAALGFLNNSSQSKGRKKKSGPAFDAQDYAANFVQRLINEKGLL